MTAFDVVFSRYADEDFDSILHFIAADSPIQAIQFVDRLQQRTKELLSGTPFAGKSLGKFRYAVFSGYVVVYLIDGAANRVNILPISEGHRDWRRLLETRD